MFRSVRGFILKGALLLGAVVVFALGWTVLRSPDPEYVAYETLFSGRFHRYDAIIQEEAAKRGMDPMVVKAVVWRESRFQAGKVGLDGERGLMQITEAAAKDWAKSEKMTSFVPSDLFDPKVNIQAGSWLLARALHRYESRDNPLPFALAEYNAGRSRVTKWTGEKNAPEGSLPTAGSRELVANIDIASTKNYIQTVQDRVQFYHQRGRL